MDKPLIHYISIEREDGAKAHFWVKGIDGIFNEDWYNSKVTDAKELIPTPKSMKERIEEQFEKTISIPEK